MFKIHKKHELFDRIIEKHILIYECFDIYVVYKKKYVFIR